MADFPVTIAEFADFARRTGYATTAEREGWAYVHRDGAWHRSPGSTWRDAGHGSALAPDHPVVIVSREDAEAFCRWVGGRLPTPEEWRWAASGARSWPFPWGRDPSLLSRCRSDRPSFGTRGRSEADFACASPQGCLDLLGNVWEWTSGESRTHSGCGVFMGGGWADAIGSLHASARHEDDPPLFRVDDVGFRVVRAHAAD